MFSKCWKLLNQFPGSENIIWMAANGKFCFIRWWKVDAKWLKARSGKFISIIYQWRLRVMWRNFLVSDELLSGTEPSKIDRRLKYISLLLLYLFTLLALYASTRSLIVRKLHISVYMLLHDIRVCECLAHRWLRHPMYVYLLSIFSCE